jgi:GDP-D-mannose dehydratase
MKKALITGITGQDGSYLAELLLWRGCERSTQVLMMIL